MGVWTRIAAACRWVWHELTRPRGRVQHRFYRPERSSRAGVAMLMALSSILLMSVLVAEIAHSSVVRLQLAAHHRDEVKAEFLANTGVQLYRLILMGSAALGRNPMIQQVSQMLGQNVNELWQLVPVINSGMMRMVFVSGGDADEIEGGELSDEQIEESREGESAFRRNFLDFDGDFSAAVQDENRFIPIANLQSSNLADLQQNASAQQILGLMAREEFRQYLRDNNLNELELVANLVDWQDVDSTRLYEGGDEGSLYANLDDPYKPKNAAFETVEEIRLVEGWHLDGVHERFGRHLTIYGGRVNVNTAHRPVLWALIQAYSEVPINDFQMEQYLDQLNHWRSMAVMEGGIIFRDGAHFRNFMGNVIGVPLRQEVEAAVVGQSEVFRVTSISEVGDARVELEVVYDFSRSKIGQPVYWKIR